MSGEALTRYIQETKKKLWKRVLFNKNVADDTRDGLPIIDPEIAEHIAILNSRRNFATTQCCAGHLAKDILARQCWHAEIPPMDSDGYISFVGAQLLKPEGLESLASEIWYLKAEGHWQVTLWFRKGRLPSLNEWRRFWFRFPRDTSFPSSEFVKVIRQSAREHPRWLRGAFKRFGLFCPQNEKFLKRLQENELCRGAEPLNRQALMPFNIFAFFKSA